MFSNVVTLRVYPRSKVSVAMILVCFLLLQWVSMIFYLFNVLSAYPEWRKYTLISSIFR